jgi:hypothetical protein
VKKLAAYAPCTKNQDAVGTCIVNSVAEPSKVHAGNMTLNFKPFNPVDKHTECAYREESVVHLILSTITHFSFQWVAKRQTGRLGGSLHSCYV